MILNRSRQGHLYYSFLIIQHSLFIRACCKLNLQHALFYAKNNCRGGASTRPLPPRWGGGTLKMKTPARTSARVFPERRRNLSGKANRSLLFCGDTGPPPKKCERRKLFQITAGRCHNLILPIHGNFHNGRKLRISGLSCAFCEKSH